MRVCIVTQECPGVTEYYGGIGTQYAAFAPEWAAAGVDTHFVTMKLRGRQAPDMLDGVHIHALGSGYFFPWHAAEWARKVNRAIAETGPYDAIISPEFRGECSVYARRQDHGPLVTHLLTSSQQLLSLRPGLTFLERRGLRTRVFLHAERTQAENSRELYAPSTAVLDWARELWPATAGLTSRVLPLAIRVEQVRRQAAAGELPGGFPAPSDTPIVGLASRLDGHKGAADLVAAMRDVWRTHSDAHLVMIGRDARYGHGMMSDHLRAAAGGHADRLHITGALPSSQYFAAVAACDVIAVPSLWESFCLAAVEAMALGRPVVATSGHGFDEYLRDGENGLLVPRSDIPALADALVRLLTDTELRASLGAAAAATAEDLDVSRVAGRYLAGFAEL